MPDPQINPNVVGVTHRAQIFAWYTFMTATLGWTHRASGKGNQGGFSVNPAAPAWASAADIDQNAWVVLQQPVGGSAPYSGTRQICLQLGGSELAAPIGATARLKYSHAVGGATGFVGGVPSAVRVPSATDEVVVYGTGTDAAPTYAAFLNGAGAENTYRSNMGGNASAPFGFWWECFPAGGGAVNFAFFMDPMATYYTASAVGLAAIAVTSYDPSDLDPNVLYIGNDMNSASSSSLCGYTTCPQGFLGKVSAGTGTFQRISPEVPYSGGGVNTVGALGTNAHTGSKYNLRPIAYSRLAAQGLPAGPKGESTFFRWKPAALATGSTLSVASALDRFIGGDAGQVWNGTVPSV